jgi:glycerol-3-phosphate O-acyltransferase
MIRASFVRLQPARFALRGLEPLLSALPVDEGWARAVRAAEERGRVVHVLRNVSLVDLLALEHFVRAQELAPIGFANELGAWVEPALARLRLHSPPPAERLLEALASGRSAALFMKRAPGLLSRAGGAFRGKSEGTDLLLALVDDCRKTGRDILFFPQAFVWTRRPERRGASLVDAVFGPVDFPGDLRAALQFFLNYKHVVVRAGEPLSLRDFLSQELAGESDEVLVHRLVYALLRKVERERRAILGPAHKPVDRVREEVLRSPKLQAAVRDIAGEDAAERAAVTDKARAILAELQATPDPATMRALEALASTLAGRVYSGIDVDREGIARVREAAQKGLLVLLPSHKSHVDYLLLSYVLRKHELQLPLIAAGDNLSFFPLGPVFRRAGAFFIRRSFRGDRLYAIAVGAYVRRLIRDGWAIEFFLEGGRSRTGKLLPPMLGMLNMVVDAALSLDGREIAFVPVSIGYERMMEEGSYARELSGAQKRPEDALGLFRASTVLRQKYGRANVQFGQIIELGELRRSMGIEGASVPPAKRRALVTRIAHQVMSEINRVTLVTPGALVATVLLCHGRRGIAHAALVEVCRRLSALAGRLGAREAPSLVREDSGELREGAVREAAALFVRGGLVREHVPGDTLTSAPRKRGRVYTGTDVIYTVPDDKRILLDISKNITVHLFVDRALVSVALLSAEGPVSVGELRERVKDLSRLFKFEFMFRADAPFDHIFDETMDDLVRQGEVAIEAERALPGSGSAGEGGRASVAFYASVVRNFLESYRIAARAARTLVTGPVAESELTARALRIGEQMFLGGEIERAEAVSGPVIDNALAAFVDQGYLRRGEGKLLLAEPYRSHEAARAIEARVARYLSRRPEDVAW